MSVVVQDTPTVDEIDEDSRASPQSSGINIVRVRLPTATFQHGMNVFSVYDGNNVVQMIKGGLTIAAMIMRMLFQKVRIRSNRLYLVECVDSLLRTWLLTAD